MRKEEILERIEETLKNWDDVVRKHEGEIRKFMREEELRELKALETASNMWIK
ncbi:hypothetical protein [Archaeoglobus veneficus]|uniref:Uncharacterized protein n=1 Tax=Archaeoglobus veneficus (strain DSM 11195 / SNP6) TaxID=693661 RepID=F2KP42_ARCVS|nr:hypothetical protein [Archaeoglobus veneficus]AEA46350.1 hypothetical protein Arcve_0316 [Archaeoglobus veneficus SNP6]